MIFIFGLQMAWFCASSAHVLLVRCALVRKPYHFRLNSENHTSVGYFLFEWKFR
jgi:hypothetical protein